MYTVFVWVTGHQSGEAQILPLREHQLFLP